MVCLKSGAADECAKTRYAVSQEGISITTIAKVGDIVGAECASDSEPFILFKALSEAYVVTAADLQANELEYKHNWMGEVKVGDQIIKGLKLEQRAGTMYTETDKVFWLFAEDARGIVAAKVMQRRRSGRVVGPEVFIYDASASDIIEIQKRVHLPGKFKPKRAFVPLPSAS